MKSNYNEIVLQTKSKKKRNTTGVMSSLNHHKCQQVKVYVPVGFVQQHQRERQGRHDGGWSLN